MILRNATVQAKGGRDLMVSDLGTVREERGSGEDLMPGANSAQGVPIAP